MRGGISSEKESIDWSRTTNGRPAIFKVRGHLGKTTTGNTCLSACCIGRLIGRVMEN